MKGIRTKGKTGNNVIRKRLLCAALALGMVIMYMPQTAFADDGTGAEGTPATPAATEQQTPAATAATTTPAAGTSSSETSQKSSTQTTTVNQGAPKAAQASAPATKTYTATFYMNDGTNSVYTTASTNPVTGYAAGTVTVPADPTRAGYTFEGWSSSRWGTSKVSSFSIRRDTQYYAIWTTEATFYMNDGTDTVYATMKTGPVTSGGSVNVPAAAPVRDGYIFAGWSDAKTGYPSKNSSMSYRPGRSYYAQWTPADPENSRWDTNYVKPSTTTDVDNKTVSESSADTSSITSADQATDPTKIYYILDKSSFTITYVIPKGYTGSKITVNPYQDAKVEGLLVPADSVLLTIKFVNNSTKEFEYLPKSLLITTDDFSAMGLPDSLKTSTITFDAQNNYNGDEKHAGAQAEITSNDAVIAAVAKQLNITTDKAGRLNGTQIVIALGNYLDAHNQTLAQYYLEYYTAKYNLDASKVKSLRNLPEQALQDIAGGYDTRYCTDEGDVNGALYDLFYNKLFSIYYAGTDGEPTDADGNVIDNTTLNYMISNTIGDYMRGTNDSTLEKALLQFWTAEGVNASNPISLYAFINGPFTTNAYQSYNIFIRANMTLSQKTYNATYVWEGDHPDAAVPTDSTKYHKGDTVTADTTQYVAGKTSLAGTKDGVEGTWTFNKWTPGEYANITGNVQFVGTWTFTPTPAPVTPDPTQPTDPTKPVVPVTPVTPDPENPQNPTTPAKTTTTTPASDKSPTTGDNWNGGLMMMLMLLGAAGAFTPLALRKKESEK